MCWCCCLPSGGAAASGWAPAVFSNYFLSPSSIERSRCPKTNWYSVQLQWLRLSEEPRTTFATETRWILTWLNEKWAVTSLSVFSGPFESGRSLKGTEAARPFDSYLFLFFNIPCFLSSIGPIRLEILTSGLINTINYCWLMKTCGHGRLAVCALRKDAFHQQTGRNCYSLQECDWLGLLHCNSAWR